MTFVSACKWAVRLDLVQPELYETMSSVFSSTPVCKTEPPSRDTRQFKMMNGIYNLLVANSIQYCQRPFWVPDDAVGEAFNAFNLSLPLALISCVCWRKLQLQPILRQSMFLLVLTGIDSIINMSVDASTYSLLKAVTVRETLESISDIELGAAHSPNCPRQVCSWILPEPVLQHMYRF